MRLKSSDEMVRKSLHIADERGNEIFIVFREVNKAPRPPIIWNLKIGGYGVYICRTEGTVNRSFWRFGKLPGGQKPQIMI